MPSIGIIGGTDGPFGAAFLGMMIIAYLLGNISPSTLLAKAKGIDITKVEAETPIEDATSAGRGYAASGGVASAIEKCVQEYYPDTTVHIEHVESLADCKKILMLAKLGKKNGCLIEGMACPGGCIAGAGTNVAILQAKKALSSFQNEAERKLPPQNAMDEAK